ncbi:hypothetical protein SETIT_8G242500v2 [Setaria italica]|uniref:Uncharacterized protein n=1 Tax=Setaria italica TaxID=4555 RepID=A0A368SBC3_SETIT|nr:hypothetical protein SETIT_8G242500v2 [Setaria italica]
MCLVPLPLPPVRRASPTHGCVSREAAPAPPTGRLHGGYRRTDADSRFVIGTETWSVAL